jgi:hypothetical protein
MAACGSSNTNNNAPDAAGSNMPDAAGSSTPTPDAPPAAVAVPFSYTPGWSGVTSVAVIGEFGQATDWNTPLVTLTNYDGTWSGIAQLPAGTYQYLFITKGDSAAATAEKTTFGHYALDPLNAAYAACPAESPTYSTAVVNPCSQITVSSTPPSVPPAATQVHMTGSVSIGGGASATSPGQAFVVVLERVETGSHHMFVNRMNTDMNGNYDLAAATGGTYRVQILYPQVYSVNDVAQTPTSVNLWRRAISPAVLFGSAAVPMGDVNMTYSSYTAFQPTPTSTPVPSTTTPEVFTDGDTTPTSVWIYPPATHNVPDPIFETQPSTNGTVSFNGTFKSGSGAAVAGTKYWWGTAQNQSISNGTSSQTWQLQSLFMPITWQ